MYQLFYFDLFVVLLGNMLNWNLWDLSILWLDTTGSRCIFLRIKKTKWCCDHSGALYVLTYLSFRILSQNSLPSHPCPNHRRLHPLSHLLHKLLASCLKRHRSNLSIHLSIPLLFVKFKSHHSPSQEVFFVFIFHRFISLPDKQS